MMNLLNKILSLFGLKKSTKAQEKSEAQDLVEETRVIQSEGLVTEVKSETEVESNIIQLSSEVSNAVIAAVLSKKIGDKSMKPYRNVQKFIRLYSKADIGPTDLIDSGRGIQITDEIRSLAKIYKTLSYRCSDVEFHNFMRSI